MRITALEGVTAVDVSCSRNATCVLTRCYPRPARPATYRLWSFGDNSRGALGLNDSTLSIVSVPTQIASLTAHSPRALASGSFHSISLCAQGCAYAWGDNMFGQLGCAGSLGLVMDGPQLVGGGDNHALSPFREWAIQATAGEDASYYLCTRGGTPLSRYV
eukprot:CAMPEP_0173056270 /NCGR_PEP_ID=MMETSP1102-20130122/27_1 /TAXON_ID=49646 /ORGANISM="Geminigera sp., Strain Caron Lab Isolate" /LENGTH=160 /DNA_ID=CAMNT_0013921527 /DNA_START=35 /DNA_END=517 /DNA_ORIENTATION=-